MRSFLSFSELWGSLEPRAIWLLGLKNSYEDITWALGEGGAFLAPLLLVWKLVFFKLSTSVYIRCGGLHVIHFILFSWRYAK